MASCLLPNSDPHETSICFVVRDLGHYHNARLRAVVATRDSLALDVIEICNRSKYPAFDLAPSRESGYRRHTLFPGRTFDQIPPDCVRSSLSSKLGSLHPAAIAVPGWGLPEALVSLAWAVGNSVPVIALSESQHHDLKRNPAVESVKRRLLSLYSAAFVGGSSHVAYAVELGLAKERVFTGYDVVDNEHFRAGAAHAREDSTLRARLGLPSHFFLTCCRFVHQKNLLRLVEAYGRYRAARPDPWSLVLLGDGPLSAEVQGAIRRLGLEKSLLTPGYMHYDVLPAYYGLAGTFILPSAIEPWGLVVNEAMAAGLPVLVSDRCGCAPELVEEGRNGFTFSPYDIEAIANAMLKVSSISEDKRGAMGGASQEIISRWTPELFAQNLEKAIQAALAAPRPSISVLDRALLWLLMRR